MINYRKTNLLTGKSEIISKEEFKSTVAAMLQTGYELLSLKELKNVLAAKEITGRSIIIVNQYEPLYVAPHIDKQTAALHADMVLFTPVRLHSKR